MKLLLDENISDEIKKLFENVGFDILDLKEKRLRQLPDKKIIDLAAKQKRIIITHDRDFLQFMVDPSCKAKMILLSVRPQTEDKIIAVANFLITSGVLNSITKSAIVDYCANEVAFSAV